MHRPRIRSRRLVPLIVVALVMIAVGGRAQAAAGDYGYEDGSYSGLNVSHPESATSDKPESKLWYAGGSWWADMWDPASAAFHIFRLEVGTQSWLDTGVVIDNRPDSDADALWDGAHLYVASHIRAASSSLSVAGQPAKLYRYSFSAGNWSLDGGFPVVITDNSSESMTIDLDSDGVLWATWTQSKRVMINTTTGRADAPAVTWGTPFTPSLTGAANLTGDDISAVVRFGGNRVMVMWSNQNDVAMYFGIHNDATDRLVWRGGAAVKQPNVADDHMNLKSLESDASGRVFAAVKTSANDVSTAAPSDPLINLLVFKPGTGSWSSSTFGTVADNHTRPIVMLDETNQLVHMFATGPSPTGVYNGAGTIYEKTAPMDSPTFPTGRGTPVIRDADSANMNNVTGSKQGVSSSTGLVTLASNEATQRYWHAYESLGPAPAPPPTFTFTPTDDATIRGDLPASNYGADVRLGADAAPQTNFLLKFNVATGCTITGAKLVVTVGNSLYDDSDHGGDFFTTGTSWSEATVTWSAAPASGTSLGSLGPVSLNTAYSIPVTSVVKTDGAAAFRISSTSSEGAKYYSKEGSTTSMPKLQVTC
jgi:hypothetical protein